MSQFTVLEHRKSKKNGPSGAPGPARTSPSRAKRGTLPKYSIFLSQLKGGPFGEKTDFRKKTHNAEKLKGGTLWDFPTSILTQNSKKLKGRPFGEKKIHPEKKSRSSEKIKGGTLWSIRYGMLRGKTGKTFLDQFARPNSAIWCNNIL